MPTLYIVRGLPGSGKSTYAKSLESPLGIIHFEADMYFEQDGEYKFNPSLLKHAHMWCYNRVAEFLDIGGDVVVSNTFTTLKEMQPYFNLAEMYNADVIIVEMKTQYGSIHNVPEETIAKMKARWQESPAGYAVKDII